MFGELVNDVIHPELFDELSGGAVTATCVGAYKPMTSVAADYPRRPAERPPNREQQWGYCVCRIGRAG